LAELSLAPNIPDRPSKLDDGLLTVSGVAAIEAQRRLVLWSAGKTIAVSTEQASGYAQPIHNTSSKNAYPAFWGRSR
jgi:hypothetical protein